MPIRNITSPPTSIPIAVPMGPASGRNVVPGMTNEPQPTAQPKESAQTAIGDKYGFNFLSLLSVFISTTYASPQLAIY